MLIRPWREQPNDLVIFPFCLPSRVPLALPDRPWSNSKLGARIYDAKQPAKSPPRLRRAQDLGAKIYGTETCKLGATNNGAELMVQILKSYL